MAKPTPISTVPTISAGGTAAAAGAKLLSKDWTAFASGKLVVSVGIVPSGKPSSLYVYKNQQGPFLLNSATSGGTISQGQEYDGTNDPIPVASGDVVNFSMSPATTLGLFEVFFSEDL